MIFLILERTQEEKDKAERDLKIILEKKRLALAEIEKQASVIKQRNLAEQKKIGKFKILAQDKEKTIERYEFIA